MTNTQTYIKISSNPLENLNSKFRKNLKNILKNNDDLIRKFNVINPSLPYLYGLIKTHKPNNPVRPIISSIGSISYKLSKYLVKLLSPLLGTISSSHIINNIDFIEKLNSFKMAPNCKMVSFDVVSLFTKVPVDDLFEFLKLKLDDANLPHTSEVIIELIKLCVMDCKLVFEGSFYLQKFGFAMGNPLSPLLSNLYMEFFETRILRRILPDDVCWLRYVDDVFCLWPQELNLENFLEKMNNLVDSIKFTLEIENNHTLPFLDILVHKDMLNKCFKFSIYRKPTNIHSYIHYFSSHPNNVKISAFHSMFLRALNVCSPEYFDTEIDFIREIGNNLKYPKHFIEKAYRNARKTFYKNDVETPFIKENLLVLPHHKELNNVKHILKNFNINIIFKNTNTIKNILIKNSPSLNPGIVYSIPCKMCNKNYIGQTSKPLQKRISQHKYSIRTGQESSALFLHLRDYNHCIDFENAGIITRCSDTMGRNIIESSIIQHKFNELINKNLGLYRLDSYCIDRIINFIFKNN